MFKHPLASGACEKSESLKRARKRKESRRGRNTGSVSVSVSVRGIRGVLTGERRFHVRVASAIFFLPSPFKIGLNCVRETESSASSLPRLVRSVFNWIPEQYCFHWRLLQLTKEQKKLDSLSRIHPLLWHYRNKQSIKPQLWEVVVQSSGVKRRKEREAIAIDVLYYTLLLSTVLVSPRLSSRNSNERREISRRHESR